MRYHFTLAYQVILGSVFGIIVGTTSSHFHWVYPVRVFFTFNLIFTDFLQWLIPLFVISYMVPTIAKVSQSSSRMLFKVFLHVTLFCYLGVLLSFLMGKELLPLLLHPMAETVLAPYTLSPFFRLPLTPLLTVSQALSLAVFLILFGKFSNTSPLIALLTDIQEWIRRILQGLILPLIPVYICSVFVRISANGSSSVVLTTLLPIIGVSILSCMALFLLYCMIGWIFRVPLSPINFLRSYKAPLGFAMASQSSSATLPITLSTCYQKGMAPEITEFVIPLATSIGAVGGSIVVIISSVSVAFLNGLPMDWGYFFSFMLNVPPSIFTSAGIPGGSSFVVAPLLIHSLHFNPSSVGFTQALILIQDPIATAMNVASSVIIALFIEKSSRSHLLSPILKDRTS